VEIDEWQAKTKRRMNNAKNEMKKTADHNGAVVLVRHPLTGPWLAGGRGWRAIPRKHFDDFITPGMPRKVKRMFVPMAVAQCTQSPSALRIMA
jgi:hypothetical protein